MVRRAGDRGGDVSDRSAPRALRYRSLESNPWGRMYDVAPDGQRFVMIRGETDAAVHVVIVFNFLEELKHQMARTP